MADHLNEAADKESETLVRQRGESRHIRLKQNSHQYPSLKLQIIHSCPLQNIEYGVIE